MEDNNTPGAPPEPVKPKTSNLHNLSFALEDLTFIDFFPLDGRKYVRFFVTGKNPAYVDMFYSEFNEYQYFIFEEKGFLIAEEADCICDTTSPILELQETLDVEINIINEDSKEEVKEMKKIPVYFAYNLVENATVGNICKTKE